jgi:diguanylate cyclase (GGDEF)-like protein
MTTDFLQHEHKRKPLNYAHILEVTQTSRLLQRAGESLRSSYLSEIEKQTAVETEKQRMRVKTLEELSTLDELTRLNNKRGFITAYKQELSRINRGFSTGGILIMLDVENIEAITNNYGIEAKNKALRMIANLLRGEVRTIDVAAKVADDEFILMMVNTSKEDILNRTQSLILALNSLSFIYKHDEIKMNISVSLKSFDKNSTLENLISTKDIFGDRKKQV